MAFEIPTAHPAKLVAGDTLKFTKAIANHTADDGWAMTYWLRGNGTGMAQSYTNTNETGDFSFYVDNRTTVEWTVGKYRYEAFVYKGGDRHRVDYGDFEILADFQNGTGAVDFRSDNQKALDAISATINGSASISEQQMQINGKMIQRFSINELIKAKAYFESEVAREKAEEKAERDGTSSGGTINVWLSDV
jgi:hypothetical protein